MDRAITALKLNFESPDISCCQYNVHLSNAPYPPFEDDRFMESGLFLLVQSVSLAYLFIALLFAKEILREKEMKMKVTSMFMAVI